MTPIMFDEKTCLLLKSEQSKKCCSWKGLGTKTQMQALKITAFVLTAGLIGITAYSVYDIVDTLYHYPLSDYHSIMAITKLTLSALLTTGIIYCLITRKCRYQWIKSQIPHHKFYQGDTFTPLNYYFQQSEDLANIAQWKPHVRRFLTYFEKSDFLLQWLAYKKFNTIESAIEPLCRELQKGLCYGYSIALLTCMPKYANESCSALLQHIQLENVVDFQLLDEFIIDCMNNEGAYSALCRASIAFKFRNQSVEWSESLKESVKPEYDSEDFLFLNMLGFDFKKHAMWYHEDYLNVNSINFQHIQETIEQGVMEIKEAQKNVRSLTIAGIIDLKESKAKEEKEGEHAGHALFFQLSDGHHRFHDSGSELAGFFEFPNEKLFFENLLEHVKIWPEFKDGCIRFTIIGFSGDQLSNLDSIFIS